MRRDGRSRCADLGVHDARDTQWDSVASATVDVIVCHEVLYLVEDLGKLMTETMRVLGKRGHAYFVTGCHTENPVWPLWKPQLQQLGHRVFDHGPFDILRAASRVGLETAMRPLRTDGWIRYSPREAEFPFPTATAMLDHHFKYKLLFRFG